MAMTMHMKTKQGGRGGLQIEGWIGGGRKGMVY